MTRRAIGFLLTALVILFFGIVSTATVAHADEQPAPDLTSRYDNQPRLLPTR